jgi:hypothetical protein
MKNFHITSTINIEAESYEHALSILGHADTRQIIARELVDNAQVDEDLIDPSLPGAEVE